MALNVIVTVDYESESASAVFSNENVEFSFNGIPNTDYYEAAMACTNGTNWEGDMITVDCGKVYIKIVAAGGHTGGHIVVKLDAAHCANAFMQAFNGLSVVEFQ